MKSIFIDDTCRLKSWGATTKAGKTLIKIEIEASDHVDAGYLMNNLNEIMARQKDESRPKRETKTAAKPLALPAPPLQLTYRGDNK